ncbi:MAG: phosphatidylserine decarboxylase [Muribaculaceae bacterium]|nr:phosphatidylserine decarboxylase [Muribaculaceae bacterium]
MSTPHLPKTQELIDLISKNNWQDKFQKAFEKAKSYNVQEMDDINSLEDYYNWLDANLRWVPVEDQFGRKMFNHICKFYFILQQSPVLELQTPVQPHDQSQPLTPLSAWMKDYIKELGRFLDSPESITDESVKSFYNSPEFNMDEYLEPRGGWKSYNEFFARSCKPGARPVAAITDSTVITSPADATFDGAWEVRGDDTIEIKGIHWKISELLEGSPYKDRFKGGMWMHSFLGPADYHRQHSPVAGRVLESRDIMGVVYLEVTAVPDPKTGRNTLEGHRPVARFDAPDTPGYEFMQNRGLVVMQSSIGLVAILPMGMGQVSSVVMTAEPGAVLRKGEEISYFQFGGSDIVMVFEAAANVHFTATVGQHYKYGRAIAKAYPVAEGLEML